MRLAFRQRWQQLTGQSAALAARFRGRAALRDGAASLRHGIANVVFPPSCLSCNAELDGVPAAGDAPFCETCLEEMELYAEPMCERCGAPVPAATSAQDVGLTPVRKIPGCYRCRGRKLWFDRTIVLGHYEGRLRDIVLRMKDAEGDALSLAMARLIWQVRGERLATLGADVVAPIPLHWRRRVTHRTNSSALLVEVLSSKLQLPRADGLLRRSRYTLKQFDLSPTERWANVRNAFALRAGYHLRGAHVLLCDDILTTGATCSEAARALLSAGASRVTVAVVARAFGSL